MVRPGILSKETSRQAEQRDDFTNFAERHPGMVCGARLGGLTSQRGQCGPVERPGLCDRLLLDLAGQLVEPIDQGFVDRAFGRSIGMIFDQGKHWRCGRGP